MEARDDRALIFMHSAARRASAGNTHAPPRGIHVTTVQCDVIGCNYFVSIGYTFVNLLFKINVQFFIG